MKKLVLLSIALTMSIGALKASVAGITLTTENKTDKIITAKIFYKETDSTGNVKTKIEKFTINKKSVDKKRAIKHPKITKITFEDDSSFFANNKRKENKNDIITTADIDAAKKKVFTVKLEYSKKDGEKATVKAQ